MTSTEFLGLVELLTGSPVKQVGFSEELFLTKALSDDDRTIDCSQFNELLLIVNKDRVEPPFFAYFFAPQYFFAQSTVEPSHCKISDLKMGVERFRTKAMLRYGNFIYAYRKLSEHKTKKELLIELDRYGKEPEELLTEFQGRSEKVLEIEEIPRDYTFFVGHLSAAEIAAEVSRARRLSEFLASLNEEDDWSNLDHEIETVVSSAEEISNLRDLIRKYKKVNTDAKIQDFKDFIAKELTKLEQTLKELAEVQDQGERNTDIYLSWDHLDIYFATSMRQRWEYEQVYDFVKELMSDEKLKSLQLRYFDPTQSFDKNRINKGLIEALMLKRAKCTVYSIQDTDTLGKDSELAVTLAQGKPVIAYAPDPPEDNRIRELIRERPNALIDKLNFLIDVDKGFKSRFSPDLEFIKSFADKLNEFEDRMLWRSVFDPVAVVAFQDENSSDLQRFCTILTKAERELYKKRAATLRDFHPLGLQVDLDSGVANGVLVVRSVAKCAELLYRILTNTMEFSIEDNKDTESWNLVESVSGSTFRVVTKNHKLTNCFWNFYL
jgi:hypothetical protein